MDNVMILMMACSIFTALVTEAVKKTFSGHEFNGNVLAAVVSVAVAGLICTGYVVMNDIAVDQKVIVEIVALIILSWLCAMVGYDKVKEAILKIGGGE